MEHCCLAHGKDSINTSKNLRFYNVKCPKQHLGDQTLTNGMVLSITNEQLIHLDCACAEKLGQSAMTMKKLHLVATAQDWLYGPEW